MKINFVSNYTASFFKESFFPALNPLHEKIFKIVSMAFVFLAVACYLIHTCLKTKFLKKDIVAKENKDRGVEESVSKEKLIDKQEIVTLPDGRKVKGEIKDGELNGEGEIFYPDGQVAKGVFKKGFLTGKGKKTYADGKVEEGEFSEGWLHGYGKSTYADGVDEGEFNYGDFVKGRVTYTDGTIEEGEFRNEVLHGKGKIIHADGKIEEGTFEYGFLVL